MKAAHRAGYWGLWSWSALRLPLWASPSPSHGETGVFLVISAPQLRQVERLGQSPVASGLLERSEGKEFSFTIHLAI